MNSRSPDPIDLFIAARLKSRRKDLRWSMQQLATRVGVSIQQVQKYESGVNRISAGRLYDMARVMRVPFAYFVDGFAALHKPTDLHEDDIAYLAGDDSGSGAIITDEARVLLDAFQEISNADVRKALLTLATCWQLQDVNEVNAS